MLRVQVFLKVLTAVVTEEARRGGGGERALLARFRNRRADDCRDVVDDFMPPLFVGRIEKVNDGGEFIGASQDDVAGGVVFEDQRGVAGG